MSDDRYEIARTVLAEMPCPVVIIAAAANGERSCATGTAMYVSFVPPAFAISVHPGSHTAKLIEASGEFSISLLSEGEVEAAAVAGHSSGTEDKLDATGLGVIESEKSGAPALQAAAMTAWCRVTHRQPTGDHVLFIGEVVDHRLAIDDHPPLLRHRRRYVRRGTWLTDELPGGYPT
jgi:flavin reductase (DIM6/NTAB) family NADH-FMN oxidoreductase RutF